jgi:hypothetical protein
MLLALATWLLAADISEFQEKPIIDGREPLQRMGRRGSSTASHALRILSYALRSPLRRRSFTFAAPTILAPSKNQRYLGRYNGIKISFGGVYNVLKRHGLNRLPDRQRKRSIPTIRYEKQVPGHHVQVDVKFLDFKTEAGRKVRYFQYTAIDDATRIRALKNYERHTQQNAIDFVDYVIANFPFRINTVRTEYLPNNLQFYLGEC